MIPLGLAIVAIAGVASAFGALTRPPSPAGGHGRAAGWELRLADLLAGAGVRGAVTPWAFVALSLAAAVASGALAYLTLRWAVLGLAAGALGALVPGLYFGRRRERRRGELQGALVDAIGQLRAGLAGGQSVQQALVDLARIGPATLRPEFEELARDLRRYGVPHALQRMRARLADPLVDTFASALIMNDRIGGRQIGPVLDQLARAARAELLLQEEMRAQQASTVLQARIIAALPWILLALLRGANPRYLAPFDSVTGQLVLLICGAVTVAAYRAMIWLGRLPGEERTLR
jgi:tight adherence protein B